MPSLRRKLQEPVVAPAADAGWVLPAVSAAGRVLPALFKKAGGKTAGAACCLAAIAVLLLATLAPAQDQAPRELSVTVGKSLLVDSPINIQRIAIGNGDIAEATATSPREVLVNGKVPGETSMIVWQQDGNRLIFDLTVLRSTVKLEAVRRELRSDFPGQDIQVDFENDQPVIKGVARDLTTAQRVLDLVSLLGKPINFLRVTVPPTDTQVLIKVRFADVDRNASQQLGINLFTPGIGNTTGSTTTGQFPPPTLNGSIGGGTGNASSFTLTQALNVFLFNPNINLGAVLQVLQARSLLQILAEPNVLAINGRPASFLAGGEFPFPNLQGGGAGLGAVTIQFREFGVRINFVPTLTPRGTIHMQVTPEVSSLDFANGLVFQGFTIPALSTRRVSTEVELSDGQSFAIGGLLDNRTTDAFSKVPGLGDIPFFGKLFRSRSLAKNNTELLVLVTPEIVRPIPAGQPLPDLKRPTPFLEPNTSSTPPQNPAGAPVAAPTESIPMEELLQSMRPAQSGAAGQTPQMQFVPMLVSPTPGVPGTQVPPNSVPNTNPSPAPAPAKPSTGGPQ